MALTRGRVKSLDASLDASKGVTTPAASAEGATAAVPDVVSGPVIPGIRMSQKWSSAAGGSPRAAYRVRLGPPAAL